MSVIRRAIKYRIFPDERQIELLTQTFGCARKVYNLGLELQEGLHEADMKPMSDFDLNNYCNRHLKEDMPYLREVDKFALTNSIKDLGRAYRNFFEGHAQHPRFKTSKDRAQSYTTNYTNGNIAVDANKGGIKLPKIGWIDACIHRKPDANWVIKQATVSKTSLDKLFVSIMFEITTEDAVPVAPPIQKTLGISYSRTLFYIDSNNSSPDIPDAYEKTERRLARERRKLKRMKKGSRNYKEQKQLIAKLHEHAANQRLDFCHKQSRKIANSYDVVCIEDIGLRTLSGILRPEEYTLDKGFGMFRTFLRYKLEEQGKCFVLVKQINPYREFHRH